jgi:anti-sigma B factor antagonist
MPGPEQSTRRRRVRGTAVFCPAAKTFRLTRALVPNLRVHTTIENGIAVLAVRGDLDLAGAGLLERALLDAQAADPPAIVLDLRDADFMDSSGLRTVIVAARRAEEDATRFALVPGKAQVMRVFQITRMEERLEFVDDPATVTGAT